MSTKSSVIHCTEYLDVPMNIASEVHIYHEGLDGKYYLDYECNQYFLNHVPVPDELIKELQLGSKSKYAELK